MERLLGFLQVFEYVIKDQGFSLWDFIIESDLSTDAINVLGEINYCGMKGMCLML